MKLLFLLLALLLATEPVASARRHALLCMGNSGVCRNSCKKDERPYFYCRSYQPCCLQSYMRISLFGAEENNDWSYEKRWPKIP
uniref:Beta-defensin 119 n=1 Tax=Propithecus coquereli TaxID=379532 RepID=A0A2K6F8Y7_PROCO